MTFLRLFLMVSGIALFAPNCGADSDLHESVADLKARMETLETLVLRQNSQLLQQDQLIQRLMAEQQQCKELRAEWEAEKMVLKDAVKEEKAHDAKSVVVQEAGNVLEASHDVIARSDDVSPLEPVVTQMAQQLTEVKAEVQTLKSADVQQDQAIQQAGTSVYVRWGNAACPASDQLVYSGVVGGSLYTNTGAATNTLCMSMTPVPSNYLPSGAPYTYVYGAEYRTHDSHHVKDAVCAVCRSPRPTTVMIPGTNKCVSGWTMEYSGFLMAGYPSQAAGSEYICVDSHFGSRAGGNSAQDGKLLYFTLAHCGALPCEPYVNGKTVTCAVCSK